ncbi:MAG: N-acetylmuramoyl-L-alanine amidase, partial [Planctomycetales bacterium]|nr:N-acetylmuramoyl-L-alanine amidase [Planctomycetales bacterium]
ITSLTYKNGVYARTTTIADLVNVYAPSSDNNNVRNYVATIEGVIASLPVFPDQTGESESADMSIPVTPPPLRIAITPYNNANRPKLVMASPTYITVHEVGNTSPGANEEMHRAFVHNGGGSAGVSFHFVVGPTEAIQLLPLDEAAWHASDGYNGTGNRDSVAIETIQIGDFDKTLWHLAWLINEIATNPQRFAFNQPRQWDFSINHIKQHHDWAPDGKNCPQFIRDRGLWPELMYRVDRWNAVSNPGGSGPEPLPDPEPEAKHHLPAGMTPQLASRLFGSYVAPWDDTVFAFDLNQAPSQVWLARGKRSVPKGKDWSEGDWPELNVVIRRGDGNQVWTWSDGSTYERKVA